MKGNIISRDGTDEAEFYIKFKGIERYHEYHSIKAFTNEWMDQGEWMETEVKSLERPKTESRRQIDLFLKRISHIPRDKSGFNNWKQNMGLYKREEDE